MLTDKDGVPVLEVVQGDFLLVDESTVCAFEIPKDKSRGHGLYLGVRTGYCKIIDDDIVYGLASDGKALAYGYRVISYFPVLEFQCYDWHKLGLLAADLCSKLFLGFSFDERMVHP